MLGIFGKLLDSNEREVKSLKTTIDSIASFEKKLEKLDNKKLQTKFEEFKKRHEKGESLEDLLPEVFASAREAAKRTINERHFDVQLMAATTLHHGKIAEQRTGEGKTLSATPAIFLNAIPGKGVHLITVNDYLAKRDAGWMGPVYHALGVTVATIVHDEAFIYDPKYKDTSHEDKRLQHLKPVSRKEAYNADITYGTNNEFGFDYLRDNMVYKLSDKAQRGHYMAIVDEVDSILIDEARTPLIISAPAQEPTEKYVKFSKLIEKLDGTSDYVIDEKQRTANLTEHGILKIEKILGVDNLYEKDFSTLHHVEEALKARTLFQKDKDYVVKDGEVIIVDEFTGRLMMGRRYSEGLHQAIEAKEGVPVKRESKTLATITLQNYFRLYKKLAGMTGTAATEAEEFSKIYNLEVTAVPTHRHMIRKDLPDLVFKTQSGKYTAVANLVEELHQKGQPVLVGTTSIDKNEFLSDLLKRKGISHALLNAKNHEKEAEIISKAGQKGSVTVATNMAGRGVDIVLSKGITELGGLFVIGTERHESRRIDNQLRGRSGRQGDPGETRFFVSLEDDLMRIFGGEQVSKVMDFLKMPADTPIEHGMVSKAIEGAQKKVEGHNFDSRKHTVEYDDVMNQQRRIIYGIRKQILEAIDKKDDSLKEEVLEKVSREIESIVSVNTIEGVNSEKIVDDFCTIISFDDQSEKELIQRVKSESLVDGIKTFLTDLARDLYEQREKQVGSEIARQMESFVYLQTIDQLWIEHLDTVDDMRIGIGLRGYAQKDPLVEYKREAYDLFEKLMANIDSEVVHKIYKVAVDTRQPLPVADLSQAREVHNEALDQQNLLEETGSLISEVDRLNEPSSGTKVKIERAGGVVTENVYNDAGHLSRKKPGRNDPCYCGSGRKY